MPTSHINAADAKEAFAELINRVTHNKERIIITRRDKEVAAIVPLEDLQNIMHKQNRSDLDEALEALSECRNEGAITLEELKEE